MKAYNEQWSAQAQSATQTFADWARDGVEVRHVDLRATNKKDPRYQEQYERLAPKEPEFT